MKIRRRRFGRLFFAIIFALLLTVGLGIAIQKQFRIQKVEVVGAQITVVIDEDKMNKNLLFFPAQKVRMEFLAQNPLLKDIHIRKKFPHTIEIIAYTRNPVARVALSDREVVVDGNGVILGSSQTEHQRLPIIMGIGEDNESLQWSLTIINGVADIFSITNIDSTTLLAKANGIDIYFPQSEIILGKVATLQTLITGFRIKGNLPKVIDLRFDKPIVTF